MDALQTEQKILQNTYDNILRDIEATEGPDADLELWKEGGMWEKKAEERLGSSADTFRRTAQTINSVIKEMMASLGIDASGKVDTSYASRFKMVWNQSEYDEMIARLNRSNLQLAELSRQTAELGPKTRRKNRGTLIRLVRGLLESVYNALNTSISCSCPGPHGVNLQLESYPPSLFKHGDEDRATEGIVVHAVMSFDPLGRSDRNTSWHWEEIAIQKTKLESSSSGDPATIQLIKRRRLRKEGGTSRSATELLAGMARLGAAVGKPSADMVLLDLCESLGSQKSLSPGDAYGYVLDHLSADECRLKVSSVYHSQTDDRALFSLKDVLLRRGWWIPRLEFRHKVKLAHLIARSLLQLSSSWLTDSFNSEHIVFIPQGSGSPFYDSVYILKRLPKSEMSSTYYQQYGRKFDLPADYRDVEERLFSLGVLLMELVLGATWESIRSSTASTSDLDVAEECLARIQTQGEHYYRAIKCCIRFEFVEPEADLDKASFRQEVYDKVVGLLEDNLN
ncbi:hypothetical protein PG993_009115 [Apiospora rasikravindrae]|uniref:DUF7580 domain-containing protein n=1 Tax=Apiospora rasikravindrae TaxID=990691 RepID=A0ABR1SIG0_9PEZI